MKVYVLQTMHPKSFPDCSKLAINQKSNDLLAWRHRQLLLTLPCLKLKYWSKFHANIILGSRVMRIFLYKELIRNPEIGNTPVWILPNIWRLGQVRDSKFSINISNEMLLNAAKCQGYSFYHFWVIKGKQTGGEGCLNYPTPRLG